MQSSFVLAMIAGAWVGFPFSHGQALDEEGATDVSLLQYTLDIQEQEALPCGYCSQSNIPWSTKCKWKKMCAGCTECQAQDCDDYQWDNNCASGNHCAPDTCVCGDGKVKARINAGHSSEHWACTTPSTKKAYYQMENGTCCCPDGEQIITEAECVEAFSHLGFPTPVHKTAKAWILPQLPGGCSRLHSNNGMKFNSHHPRYWPVRALGDGWGKPANNIAPICKRGGGLQGARSLCNVHAACNSGQRSCAAIWDGKHRDVWTDRQLMSKEEAAQQTKDECAGACDCTVDDYNCPGCTTWTP